MASAFSALSTSSPTSSSARRSPTPSPRPSRASTSGVAVVFAALFAAIAWNYVTWRVGMPSSSSHAIIGGLVGAGLAAGGLDAIDWSSVEKAGIGIVALARGRVRHRRSLAMYWSLGIQRLTKLHDDHSGRSRDCSWSRRPRCPSVTAPTTRRRRWASSPRCCSAPATRSIGADGKTSTFPSGWRCPPTRAIALGTLWGGWKIIETMGLQADHPARQLRAGRQHRRHHRDLRRHRGRHADLDHPRGRLVHRRRGRGVGQGRQLARWSARW